MIKFDSGVLVSNIRKIDSGMNRFIAATMATHARKAQAYAKRGAKWTDRTGNARGGLNAAYEGGGSTHRIVVAHSVSYGIWLEVRWSGRYAIINPTIAHEGPEVMRSLQQGFGAIFR